LIQVGAALLAFVLLLLALPVELRFQVQGLAPLQGRVAVRTVFGRWRRQLGNRAPRARVARPSGRRGGLARLQFVWRDAALRRRALDRGRAVLRTLRWRELRLHVRLGLEDPAATGRLWAFVGPLGAVLAGLHSVDIVLQPDFVEPALDFDARGRLVFVPLRLLWSLVLLAGIVGLAVARQRAGRPQSTT